jgi:hypothetical protein
MTKTVADDFRSGVQGKLDALDGVALGSTVGTGYLDDDEFRLGG